MMDFNASYGPLSEEGLADRRAVRRWLEDLQDDACGATTLQSALGMFHFFGELFDMEQKVSTCGPLKKMAKDWLSNTSKEPNRAKAFQVRLLYWLEKMALNITRLKADRALCGRIRISANASIRNDDMKKTPIARCEWILFDSGEVRALRTRAAETKTAPRHWICSCKGVTPETDGWLESTMQLLEESHGETLLTDDHFGKQSLPDRSGWEKIPTDGSSDASHLRYLMSTENEYFMGKVGFDRDEIQKTRVHGAKATMVTLGMHKEASDVAVRHQGGWRGKSEQTMPDTYLRESQLLALKLQERCLDAVRAGDHLIDLPSRPVFGVDTASKEVSLAMQGQSPSKMSGSTDDALAKSKDKLTVAKPRIWYRENSDDECGSEELDQAESAEEASDEDRCQEEVPSEESDVPEEPRFVGSFLWTQSSGKYHAAVELDSEDTVSAQKVAIVTSSSDIDRRVRTVWRAECNRGVSNVCLWAACNGPPVGNDSSACGICFPASKTYANICDQICGAAGPDGSCCRERCKGSMCLGSNFAGHACSFHLTLEGRVASVSGGIPSSQWTEEVTTAGAAGLETPTGIGAKANETGSGSSPSEERPVHSAEESEAGAKDPGDRFTQVVSSGSASDEDDEDDVDLFT